MECQPRLLKTLRNPMSSGAVSCVAAFPDGRHIAVASNDNIQLWNASEEETGGRAGSGVPFKIIPGHHGGIISQMLIDRAARFMSLVHHPLPINTAIILFFPPLPRLPSPLSHHLPMPLPKRYYDQIDDGAPGDDDARYASETYNTMTALPPGFSRSQPPQHPSSSSSQLHTSSSSQQQPQQPFQPRPMIPLPGTFNVNVHYDASQFAPVSYSVTPPLSIPAVPAIPPPPPALSAHAGFPAIPPLQSPVSPSGSGRAAVPADASMSASGSGPASDMVSNRPRRRIIPPDAPAHSVMDDDEETYTYTLTDELRATMFREVHGRQLNTMQPVYQLPADADEIKREEYFHKLMYMVYGDKLWEASCPRYRLRKRYMGNPDCR
ncbi:SPT8_1 [Sanghuangporus vaninii]